MKLPWTPD